jgi:protein SCO1
MTRARLVVGLLPLALMCSSCEETGRALPLELRAFANARELAAFSLVDHHGRSFDRARLIGHWTFLTFGYVDCPDVCPTTLVNLALLKRSLARDWRGAPPQFVFVSVDPARDSIALLGRYVTSFDPQFLGATGTQEAVDRMHESLSGMHRLGKPRPGRDALYRVDHSALLYVIDPEGRLHAQVAPPYDPAALARRIMDMAQIFAGRWPIATDSVAGTS